MKKTFAIFLLLPLLAWTQRDSLAMKKANRIIVVTNKSTQENRKAFVSVLKANGYMIQSADSDSVSLTTDEKQANSATVSYHLKGLIKEKEIILSGIYSSRVDASFAGTNYKVFQNEISKKGGKNSGPGFAFEAMDGLAGQLGGKVFYAKEKLKKTSIF